MYELTEKVSIYGLSESQFLDLIPQHFVDFIRSDSQITHGHGRAGMIVTPGQNFKPYTELFTLDVTERFLSVWAP